MPAATVHRDAEPRVRGSGAPIAISAAAQHRNGKKPACTAPRPLGDEGPSQGAGGSFFLRERWQGILGWCRRLGHDHGRLWHVVIIRCPRSAKLQPDLPRPEALHSYAVPAPPPLVLLEQVHHAVLHLFHLEPADDWCWAALGAWGGPFSDHHTMVRPPLRPLVGVLQPPGCLMMPGARVLHGLLHQFTDHRGQAAVSLHPKPGVLEAECHHENVAVDRDPVWTTCKKTCEAMGGLHDLVL
mmetsp:Transcript_38285/g.88834  ORF Transcript_38285/g.88834 Transcript_38285/m.88834 type:complete len:241 (+) Transcript_38285:245-967(+)